MIEKLAEISTNNSIIISAITYAEMRYGCIGKKALPKHTVLVNQFLKCLDAVLPWDMDAVDAAKKLESSCQIKEHLLALMIPLLQVMQFPKTVFSH